MSMISTEEVAVEYVCYRCGRQGVMVVNPPSEYSDEVLPSNWVVCPGCNTMVVGRPVTDHTRTF